MVASAEATTDKGSDATIAFLHLTTQSQAMLINQPVNTIGEGAGDAK